MPIPRRDPVFKPLNATRSLSPFLSLAVQTVKIESSAAGGGGGGEGEEDEWIGVRWIGDGEIASEKTEISSNKCRCSTFASMISEGRNRSTEAREKKHNN